MKKKLYSFFLLLIFISCSNLNSYRTTSSIFENNLDPKFEEYEGGSQLHEKRIHKKIIDFSIQMLEKNQPKYKNIPRDAHAKSHGCLKASFEVDNQFIKAQHRKGVFALNRKYDALIRYSNNDHLPFRKDKGLDLRGMAIKIFGVPGEKIGANIEHEEVQDFLMYGSKTFFIKNNADYIGFVRSLRDENSVSTLLKEQPRAAVRTVYAQAKLLWKKNPFSIKYFSATPVRLGRLEDENRSAMKYGVYPCKSNKVKNISGKKRHDYMRENLIHTLEQSQKICLEFRIQTQDYPEVMPIEDATVKWPEKPSLPMKFNLSRSFSPYKKVATINIEYADNVDISSGQRRDLCEHASFSPWNSLIEHKPLGRTMRMRRDVYKAISDFRRSKNMIGK